MDVGRSTRCRQAREQQHFGPPGLVGTGEKAKNFKGSFKRLMRTLRPERKL